MAGSPGFPRLRGGSHPERTQDSIAQQLEPIGRALAATPIMGGARPAWIAPDLQAPWANFAGFAAAGFHRDALGYVHGKGVVSNTSGVAVSTLVCTLPQGYRPRETYAIAVPAGGAAIALLINPDGTVLPNSAVAAGAALGLAFSFLAEQ
jgi:hypothetical protein